MSKKLFLAAATLAVISATGVANAACQKGGAYVGLGLGTAIEQLRDKNGKFNGSISKTKFAVQLLGGYRFMVTDKFYTDLEASLGMNFGSTTTSSKVNFPVVGNVDYDSKGKSKFNFGLRIKPGFYITDSTSVYGILGLNMSRYSLEWNTTNLQPNNISGRLRKTLISPELGLGFDTDIGCMKDWKLFGQVSKVLNRKLDFKAGDVATAKTIEEYGNALIGESYKNTKVGEWRFLVGVKKYFF